MKDQPSVCTYCGNTNFYWCRGLYLRCSRCGAVYQSVRDRRGILLASFISFRDMSKDEKRF